MKLTNIPKAWKEAARKEGLTVAQWVRAACELAIARVHEVR